MSYKETYNVLFITMSAHFVRKKKSKTSFYLE